MGATYLQSADYPAFGVPNATASQVQAASALIDAYLRRPEGILYGVDFQGRPAYMLGKDPSATLTAPQAIAAGSNVVIPVTGPIDGFQPGQVVIVDRANQAACEPGVVVQISPADMTVTLATVKTAHAAGASLELDMAITEQKYMPQGRPLTNVANGPIVRLLAGQGRYAYGRRGRVNDYALEDFNLLASMQTFGGPPLWENFDITHAGFDAATGQVWVPAGIMPAYYSEVRLHYIAGFAYANLPRQVKQAMANIIQNQAQFPQLVGSVVNMKAGDIQVQRMSDEVLDANTKRMLDPYRTRTFT